jgi:nicotinamide-nucleotide amidase
MNPSTLQLLSQKLLEKKWLVATAESCTGGLLSKRLTDESGSSAWFDSGFITYSDAAKEKMLGVQASTLAQYGAVSEDVAREMAEGALKRSHAHVSIAITGIAGPTGGSEEKPIGTVWFAWAGRDFGTATKLKHFHGDRAAVREEAAEFALVELLEFID